MNRTVTLVLIAGAVFLVILFVSRPDLLENIWLWLIGLSGTIIQAFKSLIEYFKGEKSETEVRRIVTEPNSGQIPTPNVPNPSEPANPNIPVDNIDINPEGGTEPKPENIPVKKDPLVLTSPLAKLPEFLMRNNESFTGWTIDVLRGSDDGQTTIGWLYLNGEYFCYTLEDTFREIKVKHQTRIPCGTYKVNYNRVDTDMTLKYRERCQPWFSYHLHLKNVPNFEGIYIHSGGNYKHTSGCLLVSDSLVVTENSSFFNNSRNTFKRLYEKLSAEIENKVPIRIVIHDEHWKNDINI